VINTNHKFVSCVFVLYNTILYISGTGICLNNNSINIFGSKFNVNTPRAQSADRKPLENPAEAKKSLRSWAQCFYTSDANLFLLTYTLVWFVLRCPQLPQDSPSVSNWKEVEQINTNCNKSLLAINIFRIQASAFAVAFAVEFSLEGSFFGFWIFYLKNKIENSILQSFWHPRHTYTLSQKRQLNPQTALEIKNDNLLTAEEQTCPTRPDHPKPDNICTRPTQLLSSPWLRMWVLNFGWPGSQEASLGVRIVNALATRKFALAFGFFFGYIYPGERQKSKVLTRLIGHSRNNN